MKRSYFIIIFVILVLSGATNILVGQNKDIPTASKITQDYTRVLHKRPIPKQLKDFVIPEKNNFHLEAAIIQVEHNSMSITVVTKESDLPDTVACIVIMLSEGSNPAGVGSFFTHLGDIGYTDMRSSAFTTFRLLKVKTETPKRVSLFKGFSSNLQGDILSLGFDAYVAIQLCTGVPGLVKPVSNFLWVKVLTNKIEDFKKKTKKQE